MLSVYTFSNPVATRLDTRPSEDQSWQFHNYYTKKKTNYYDEKQKEPLRSYLSEVKNYVISYSPIDFCCESQNLNKPTK